MQYSTIVSNIHLQTYEINFLSTIKVVSILALLLCSLEKALLRKLFVSISLAKELRYATFNSR
jgi:hypothetical protein